MKDFFGFELRVGDTVAIHTVLNCFVEGIIIRIDNLRAVVSYYDGACLEVNLPGADIIKRVFNPDDLKLIKFAMGTEQ